MRVLLSDGSGLTARQCATLLSKAGHTVEALSPEPLCLCRCTRHVRRVHRVPSIGTDPFGWLDAALAIYQRGGFDVLLPTQEQVAVLASAPDRLRAAGVATAVPAFDAVARVQDKLSAFATLTELALRQPASTVITSAAELAGWRDFPSYLKVPIGTASAGVCRVRSAVELAALPSSWAAAADNGRLLAQRFVPGNLAMVQAVFDHGRLVACHANERVREGAGGGASLKRSLDLPAVREQMGRLGEGLAWHGALSADVILGPDGPVFIDINPRLVEPMNAWRSVVDLVGALLDIALGRPTAQQPPGTPGVRTHQLLLAILGAAGRRGLRRDVLGEIVTALTGRSDYAGSTEELTPRPWADPRSLAVLVAASAAVLVRPATGRWFSGGSVAAYALTPEAWHLLQAVRRTV